METIMADPLSSLIEELQTTYPRIQSSIIRCGIEEWGRHREQQLTELQTKYEAALASIDYESSLKWRYMKIAGAYKTLFEEEQALRSSHVETI